MRTSSGRCRRYRPVIRWRLLIDTNIDDALTDNLHHDDGQSYPVASRSTVVFVREEDPSKIPAISA